MKLGLDEIDRRILSQLLRSTVAVLSGLDTIGAAISEESATIMDVYEPYLDSIGFHRSHAARAHLHVEHAYKHLGIAFPDDPSAGQQRLI